jgi:hypothetical protein
VGGDSGSWGAILNEFLEAGHSPEGLNKGALVETIIGSPYTVSGTDNGTRLVVTAGVTLTVPAVGTLGNGFECEIVNDSGDTVTLEGPNDEVELEDGDIACLVEANGKLRVAKGASSLIS